MPNYKSSIILEVTDETTHVTTTRTLPGPSVQGDLDNPNEALDVVEHGLNWRIGSVTPTPGLQRRPPIVKPLEEGTYYTESEDSNFYKPQG